MVNDMKDALYQIKNDLGPEAMIINSRKVRSKGLLGLFVKRKLEVTAAVDEFVETGNRQKLTHAVRDGSIASGTAERLLLLNRTVRDKESSHEDTFVSKWRQILLDIDLDEGLVEHLLYDLNDSCDTGRSDRDEMIKLNLTNRITRLIEPAYHDIKYSKVYAFIGPTGVGKTTTLAKLAAQFTLFHQKKIALITIDTYRIGAVEQLKTYGEIIGVPLDVVMTSEELHRTVMKHKDKDLIFIDTAGRPSSNVAQVKELMEFLGAVSLPLDTFLVLSATTKNKDMIKCIKEYGRIDINKIIFTKIDETRSLGSMLNVIYRTNIPIYYITDGQSVPDDIEQVYPEKLAKLLLKGVINQNDGSGF